MRAVVPSSRRPEHRRAKRLLSLDHVSVRYGRHHVAVRDVSFTIAEGETFALVGESGSGKSTIARAISGLVPPSGRKHDLLRCPSRLPGALKGKGHREQRRVIQFIFQNPDASLNPRARIGAILKRPIECSSSRRRPARHEPAWSGRSTMSASMAAMREGLADQLSGGERQRVAIARALVAKPLLLLLRRNPLGSRCFGTGQYSGAPARG